MKSRKVLSKEFDLMLFPSREKQREAVEESHLLLLASGKKIGNINKTKEDMR